MPYLLLFWKERKKKKSWLRSEILQGTYEGIQICGYMVAFVNRFCRDGDGDGDGGSSCSQGPKANLRETCEVGSDMQ